MACSSYMQGQVWLRPPCSCMNAKTTEQSGSALKLSVQQSVYWRCGRSGFSSMNTAFATKHHATASTREFRPNFRWLQNCLQVQGFQNQRPQSKSGQALKESRRLGLGRRTSTATAKPWELHERCMMFKKGSGTKRLLSCSAVQGGESQGKRGAAEGEGMKVGAEGSEEEKDEAPEGESSTDKFLREMRKKAEEQAKRDKEAEVLYKYGQREYGRGEYASAVKALQAAVDLVARGTALGGEMQIWLAMAFDANGQRDEGLAVYRKLEASHPMKAIKLQAANLRYIMEAPRLKISKDERVTIPLIGDESQTGNPSFTEQYTRRANSRKIKKIKPDIWDRIDWSAKPRWQRNPYFWVALTLWLTLIAVTMAFGD